ncbi:MAG: pseudouridine synthase, partial [Myxococcales bacterium]
RTDRVTLDGREVPLTAAARVLAFHKPAGVVTAPSDPEGQGTVYDVLLPKLPPALRGYYWHAVGRLDRNTTGLLLFTNDERVVEHVTSPKTHLPKRYVAEVQGTADEAKVEPLRQGVVLDDGPTRPAEVRLRGPSTVELTLSEGRYHQVKKMLAAVKLPVRALHREAVGGLSLDVEVGGWRELSAEEIRERLGYDPARGPGAARQRPPDG